jgi:hypothetical protein
VGFLFPLDSGMMVAVPWQGLPDTEGSSSDCFLIPERGAENDGRSTKRFSRAKKEAIENREQDGYHRRKQKRFRRVQVLKCPARLKPLEALGMANKKRKSSFDEKYALKILSAFVDSRYGTLVQRETSANVADINLFPDFVPGGSFDVGLEVTSSKTKEDGQTDAWCHEVFGKGLTAQQMMDVKDRKYTSLNANIMTTPVHHNGKTTDVKFIATTYDSKDHIDYLAKTITRKTTILNSKDGHAALFGKNVLFVFLSSPLSESNILEACSECDFSKSQKRFDMVYFFDEDELFGVAQDFSKITLHIQCNKGKIAELLQATRKAIGGPCHGEVFEKE